MKKIGVDIGGSHITSALINNVSGEIIDSSYTRKRIDPHASADHILNEWANAIQSTRLALPDEIAFDQHLGFAMPGPFDYAQGISHMTKAVDKYENLYSINIRSELSRRLNIEPANIKFRNDSEAFLEGEMHYGAGKGFQSGIGLTIGTGLGTSIYTNRKAQDMGLGITHPFQDSVIEEHTATRWFVRRYHELTKKQIHGAKELVEAFDTDPTARQIFKEFSQNLAQFILEFLDIHYPEVIVIGGNIAQSSAYFFPEIEKHLSKLSRPIVLKASALNERAALIGAIV